MTNTPPAAPESICLLRLSALGDVTHFLPIVHALQVAWPQSRITWIVGRREHALVSLLPNVEFLILDKKRGLAGYLDLARQLSGRRFSLLLLMQVSLRAHLASLLVRAPRRLGYDAVRSRDLHRLFINERIAFIDRQHVLDGHRGFLHHLGIRGEALDWSLPLPAAARSWAEAALPGEQATLIISPSSSVALRNWHAQGYAQVADYAITRHGMRVVLCGGPAQAEREFGAQIAQHMQAGQPIDLIGKDTIPQFLALLERAQVLIGPDSGPAHMAAITDTPVIGLYALSNPQRCGPYKSLAHCVDAYPQACAELLGKPADTLPWGTRVEHPEAMRLIQPEQVMARLDALRDAHAEA